MVFYKIKIFVSDPFAIVHKYECNGLYYLVEDRYKFNLTKEGLLDFQFLDKPVARFKFGFEDRISYCIEHKDNKFHFFMCLPEYPSPDKFIFTEWAKIASCVFLVLTIVVYLVLKKANNLFGKSLICYCFTELLTMSVLLYVHTHKQINDKPCLAIGIFTRKKIYLTVILHN